MVNYKKKKKKNTGKLTTCQLSRDNYLFARSTAGRPKIASLMGCPDILKKMHVSSKKKKSHASSIFRCTVCTNKPLLVAAYCILKLRNNATYLLGSVETLKMTIRFYSRTFYYNRRMPLISYVNKRSLNNSTLVPTFISTCYFSNNFTTKFFPLFFFFFFTTFFPAIFFRTERRTTKQKKLQRRKIKVSVQSIYANYFQTRPSGNSFGCVGVILPFIPFCYLFIVIQNRRENVEQCTCIVSCSRACS